MNSGATLAALNAASPEEARVLLARCCGARRWVEAMLEVRPFPDAAALLQAADRADRVLSRQDWLEAFSHHPRIGEQQLRERFPETSDWASAEQAGVPGAAEAVLAALARGNEEYHQEFGYIFIVCASGRSAEEMLAALNRRLGQDPEVEWQEAAGEQAKITRIRLRKFMEEVS